MTSCNSLRKCELHVHLGGSWPLSYLESIGAAADVDAFKRFLDLMDSNETDYHSAFESFALAAKIVDTDEKVQMGVKALCKHYVLSSSMME